MSVTNKIAILCCIISFTLVYSFYEKRKLDEMQSTAPVLATIPEFNVQNLSANLDSKTLDKIKLLEKKHSLVLVHFWGTWCAPCEYELPEFVELSTKLEKLNVGVVLIAVNDELKKVKKYMGRYKSKLTQNIYWTISEQEDILDYFGTVKVPETYVFDSKGKSLRKFVGPQDWSNPTFFQRIQLLTISN